MHKAVVYINETTQISQRNTLKKLEVLFCYQPKTSFQGGTIKWFDDSKLIKK